MAVQQINLSNVGYLDQAGALGHQGAFDEIVFYDDAAQTRRYFTTNGDGTPAGLANPFNGSIDDAGTPANGWWAEQNGAVYQINANGDQLNVATTTTSTTEATTTLPIWTVGNVEIADGLEGESILQYVTLTGGGTVDSVNPLAYVFGTDTYAVTITGPTQDPNGVDYANPGEVAVVTVTGVNVTQAPGIEWDANNAGDITVPSSGQDATTPRLQ